MAAPTVQMIDGEGAFHEDELKAFVTNTGVADSRANYQVGLACLPAAPPADLPLSALPATACLACLL